MVFVKGQSGNPGGRRKKYITQLIEDIGKEIEPKSGKPFEELIARRLWVDAVNGKGEAIKEILNRVEGLPQAFTQLSTPDGKPLINISYGHRRADKPTTKTKDSS
jgi:hypothetical protein